MTVSHPDDHNLSSEYNNSDSAVIAAPDHEGLKKRVRNKLLNNRSMFPEPWNDENQIGDALMKKP